MAFAFDTNISQEVEVDEDNYDEEAQSSSLLGDVKYRKPSILSTLNIPEKSTSVAKKPVEAIRVHRYHPLFSRSDAEVEFYEEDDDEQCSSEAPNFQLKCNHFKHPHFTRSAIDAAIKQHKLCVVMNPPSNSIVWSFCGCPEIDDHLCSRWVICTVCRAVFRRDNEKTVCQEAKRHIEVTHGEIVAAVQETAIVDGVFGQISMIDGGQSNINVRLINDDDLIEEVEEELEHRKRRKVCGTCDEYSDDEQFRDEHQNRPRNNKRTPRGKTRFISMSSLTNGASKTSTFCDACNIDFRNVALAMMHKNSHGKSARFQCSQCRVIFGTVFDFWSHIFSKTCK